MNIPNAAKPDSPGFPRAGSKHPNTLFHFTKLPGLTGILHRRGFQLSYAREKLLGPAGKIVEMAIPMVSFCDLRLSELASHMDKYGRYGIGLSKEWGNRKGLNPVAYVNANSELANSVIEGIEKVLNMVVEHPNDDEDHSEAYLNVMNMQRFMKSYQGPLERNGVVQDEMYRFADEKEWRYVLPLKYAGDIFPYANMDEVDTAEKKAGLNAAIQDELLEFAALDVKYIVVEYDREIGAVQDEISRSGFSDADTLHLISRVLSAERIVEDF
jgi:hypothetical protein